MSRNCVRTVARQNLSQSTSISAEYIETFFVFEGCARLVLCRSSSYHGSIGTGKTGIKAIVVSRVTRDNFLVRIGQL